MSPKTVRRGYEPQDNRFFSEASVESLSQIQEELQYLLDHGYSMKPTITFVGNRYRLSTRQRTALKRASATTEQYHRREAKRLPYEKAAEDCLNIDGFNLIIPLEVALSGSVLILGKDQVIRDLAGLRGTYSIIDKTEKALDLIGHTFKALNVPKLNFYLDAPVSNSGRLKRLILKKAEQWQIPTEVLLVTNPDTVLSEMDRVVTGDSVIIDHCGNWFNMAKKIIEDHIPEAWVIEF